MDEYWAKVEEGKNIARRRMGVFDYFKHPIPSPAASQRPPLPGIDPSPVW